MTKTYDQVKFCDFIGKAETDTLSCQTYTIKNEVPGGFPGGPVIKNLPCNAGDMGSVPGLEIKIAHAAGQLSS